MKIERTWKDSTGRTITCRGYIEEEKVATETQFSDGWNVAVEKKVPARAYWEVVDGEGFLHGGKVEELTMDQKKRLPEGFTHKVGRVVLNAERLALVLEVKNAVEASAAAVQVKNDTDREQAEDEKLRGQEAKSVANGLCRKCGTYCFGDCG